MSDRLDDLLQSLPGPGPDRSLDGLEPAVWGRIQQGERDGVSAGAAVRLQLVAAGMALCIGLALGWSMHASQVDRDQQALFASYAEVGPLGRLEGPL